MKAFHETVEAEGHLIDSHVMEAVFDKVVEHQGSFQVEEFRIGRTNSEPSYMRMRVESPTEESMGRLLEDLLGFGCSPVSKENAVLREVERDCCAPEDFYSTTNHRTQVRIKRAWEIGRASCRERV